MYCGPHRVDHFHGWQRWESRLRFCYNTIMDFCCVHEAVIERHVLDPFRAGWGINEFRKVMRVAPFWIYVGDRKEAVKVVEADVLWLLRGVLSHLPFSYGLRDVSAFGQ